jgi:hypothetical protein
MKIFIGGSISIHNLNCDVKERFNKFIAEQAEILVGDAYGIDSLVQMYLSDKNYSNVTIYASNGKARNNIGNWKIKAVNVGCNLYGRAFFTQKDIAMTNDCDCALMIWDGNSKGTFANIERLKERHKNCDVYVINNKERVIK